MHKSPTDYMVGGVCGGLGAATPIPSWMRRVVFLSCLLAFGGGSVVYIILWICLPEDDPKRKQDTTPPAAS